MAGTRPSFFEPPKLRQKARHDQEPIGDSNGRPMRKAPRPCYIKAEKAIWFRFVQLEVGRSLGNDRNRFYSKVEPLCITQARARTGFQPAQVEPPIQ